MTRKVMNIECGKVWLEAVYHVDKEHPFRLYNRWYEVAVWDGDRLVRRGGYRRKQIGAYDTFYELMLELVKSANPGYGWM